VITVANPLILARIVDDGIPPVPGRFARVSTRKLAAVPIPTTNGRHFADGLVVMTYVEGGSPDRARSPEWGKRTGAGGPRSRRQTSLHRTDP
jgi:hypothetical protein